MPQFIAASPDRPSPWFDIDMHIPVHVGVFEVKVAGMPALGQPDRQGYCHWDGQRFGGVTPAPDDALALRTSAPGSKVISFRGVDVGLRWIPRPAPEVAVDDSNRRTLMLLNRIESKYARYDEAACAEMLFRLEKAARLGRLLTYAQFVRGVKLTLPDDEKRTLQRRTIDLNAITPSDQEVICDFAFYLGAATYRDSKVLISALLTTTRAQPQPPSQFFNWARRIGQYAGTTRDEADAFWCEAVAAVHERYARTKR